MASGSAVKKSADIRAHLAAIENFETLFASGQIRETHTDRDNNEDIKAIHRVYSQMGPYDVKFTVKELVQSVQGNRIYSIEAVETERASERKRDEPGTLASPTSSPQSEAQEQTTSVSAESQISNNTSPQPLWNGITGYDRRGNPKTVVILGRQDSGAYSIKINGTTHDFSETQTAAITGLTADQLRALRAGDASAQPVLVAKAAAPAPAKQSPTKPTNEQAQDRSEELTVKKTDADKKHLTGTTEDSINHKLQTYLLNPLHAVGGPKSVWFKGALGFTQSNADDLARQLIFDTRTAYEKEKTKYGQKFDQLTPLQGANGKIISLKVTWIKNPDGVIRLVTITPKNKKHD